MDKKQLRPWWLRKRFVFFGLFPLALLVSVAVAYVDSDTSNVVVYNNTGKTLPPLLVKACGQERSFRGVDDQASVCLRLEGAGGATPVHLELATDPLWKWDGQSITPAGGVTVTVRLWPGGQVDAFRQVSWWRDW